MSNNIFRDAAEKMKNNHLVIPLTLVFLAMFFVSCALMYEDYSTSRLGYLALPTRKANPWVIPLVALLPQLGQVGFAYVFASDTRKRWSLAIAGSLWLVDVATDVYYKAYGMGAAMYGLATVETITIYSLGSEVMMATSVGMLAMLLPPFFKRIAQLTRSLFTDSPYKQGRPKSNGQFKSGPVSMKTSQPPLRKPVSSGFTPGGKGGPVAQFKTLDPINPFDNK